MFLDLIAVFGRAVEAVHQANNPYIFISAQNCLIYSDYCRKGAACTNTVTQFPHCKYVEATRICLHFSQSFLNLLKQTKIKTELITNNQANQHLSYLLDVSRSTVS